MNVAYGVGKAGLDKLSRDMAHELREHGVAALSLWPGLVSTERITAAMGEETLAAYVGDSGVNTDNHPYLEFTPAMAYFLGDLYRLRNLLDFREARENVLPWVVNLGDTPEEIAARTQEILTRYEAVSHSLDGDVFLVLDERERAIEEYGEALRIDPLEKNWLNTVWEPAQGGAER